MEKWFIKNIQADFAEIARRSGVSEILTRLIINRGVSDLTAFQKYIEPGKSGFYSPSLLKDMDRAVNLIKLKINEKKRIRIIGDYDVDGVMSVYILKTALDKCGASVDERIPDRIQDGYGLNVSMIEEAHRQGIDTILTCDNGISAEEQICRAKQLGMTVIVTDHHEIPFEESNGRRVCRLPSADVIVDPKQEQCAYPFKQICGAVVALKFAEALYAALDLKDRAWDDFGEFAAIATVCDVMELVDENRVIVKMGLEALCKTRNTGMRALLRVTGLAEKAVKNGGIGAYHLGYILGPCINATGRLDSAVRALDLFQEKDEDEAVKIADSLKELNEQRKNMTNAGVKQAVEAVEHGGMKNDRVLVVYLPECHESLAGIIAGRLREQYYRPAFVLTDGGGGLKGSGRSIEEYSMFERLNECGELLRQFGGHPMAAGLSLDRDKLEALRASLNEKAGLEQEDMIPKVTFDMVLPLKEASVGLVNELSILEPFGKGNKKPLFARKHVEFLRGSVVGAGRNVIRITLREDGRIYPAVLFQKAEKFEEELTERCGANAAEKLYGGNGSGLFLDILYCPETNTYNGQSSLQFVIEHFR